MCRKKTKYKTDMDSQLMSIHERLDNHSNYLMMIYVLSTVSFALAVWGLVFR